MKMGLSIDVRRNQVQVKRRRIIVFCWKENQQMILIVRSIRITVSIEEDIAGKYYASHVIMKWSGRVTFL